MQEVMELVLVTFAVSVAFTVGFWGGLDIMIRLFHWVDRVWTRGEDD